MKKKILKLTIVLIANQIIAKILVLVIQVIIHQDKEQDGILKTKATGININKKKNSTSLNFKNKQIKIKKLKKKKKDK